MEHPEQSFPCVKRTIAMGVSLSFN